jgi:hypothetical protein
MTIERYMMLRSELAAVRVRGLDSPDEDRLLGEMDDAWWRLPQDEQQQIRMLLAIAREPRIEFRVALGRSAATATSQSTEVPRALTRIASLGRSAFETAPRSLAIGALT